MIKTKYNIIGDTHGRDTWIDLVREDCVNIFVGDYFSPYDKSLDFDTCRTNFMNIIMYKLQHPETILLIGNHDLDHWYIHERYSRFDSVHYTDIYNLFEENKDLLQMAYAIDDNVLVTHAGVSAIWYERYHKDIKERWGVWYNSLKHYNFDGAKTIEDAFEMYKENTNKMYADSEIYNINSEAYTIKEPAKNHLYFWIDGIYTYENNKFVKKNYTSKDVANFINNLFENGIEERGRICKYYQFNFDNNTGPCDSWGDDERQSPVWIRPEALSYVNIFEGTDIWQVVGHTQYNGIDIDEKNKIVHCDCLNYKDESVIYNSNTKKFEINKINKN